MRTCNQTTGLRLQKLFDSDKRDRVELIGCCCVKCGCRIKIGSMPSRFPRCQMFKSIRVETMSRLATVWRIYRKTCFCCLGSHIIH